jgi:acyl carrier protein
MNSREQIAFQIRSYVLDKFPLARQHSLAEEDALLGSGIVDSLGVLDLVAFVEETFDVAVDVEDLQPENFESIARMTAFVEIKMNGMGVFAEG